MKKLLYSAALLCVVGFTSSCAKDYTCECKFDDGSGTPQTTSVTIHESKGDAEDACEAMNSSTTSGGTTMTSTCSIK